MLNSMLLWINMTMYPTKTAMNKLGPAWQNIAGNHHIRGQKKTVLSYSEEAFGGGIKQPNTLI